MKYGPIVLLSLALVIVPGRSSAQFIDVGSLDFPTSGSPEAQPHFLRGVATLHSFGWKQASEQFQEAPTALWKVTPAGRVSVTVTSLAASGPLLVTDRV